MVFLTILMLLITFVSCDNKLNVSHTNAVRFSTEIGRKAIANSEWQAADEVGIYMVAHDALAASAASERANKLYTADTAFQTSGFTPATAGDTLKWDDISNPAITHFDFIAYYPYVSPIADTTALPIHVYPGSGEQDTGKADFLWGRTDNVQNNTSTVHLKLDHMLSRLIVNISPSTTVDKDAINDATGGFTATVTGLNTQTAINLNDGTLGTHSEVESILMKDISDTLTTTERAEGKRRFEAVLIPVGNTDALANVSLEFTLTGGARAGTYTWKPSTTGAVADGDKHLIHFDKGKQHVYNMTLNTSDDEVAVAAIEIEIQDWDTGDGINAPAVKVRVKSVSAGYSHTMILKTDGTLWATGRNNYGQLGVGDTTNRRTPVQVWDSTDGSVKMTDVAAVSAGSNHTMILKKDGTLWAMGYNYFGQLGDDTTDNKSTPVQVKDDAGGFMTDVKTVSAGGYHTTILKEDGTLWATGSNQQGQLGVGNTTNRSTPVQVKASTAANDFMIDVKEVSAGTYHTTILKEDGTLWATGYNSDGQLGDGTTTARTTPVRVKDTTDGSGFMTDVAAFSAGNQYTMIVKTDDTLWATGSNNAGQLGDGTVTARTTPVRVKASTTPNDFMTDVKAVSAGYYHTLILKNDETLWATGQNTYGQLGDSTTTTRTTPVQVKASTTPNDFMTDVAAVSAGGYHTIILKTDGTLWATGNNGYGQLGDGTSGTVNNKSTPVQVVF
ncbi:fimbrillin family protein [Parasphaerochaeta coccoides]|uniref:Regulator of chromosome condensation RCC1 n=1 Tax=Parasphaerochaeta coccoides (strain ATCC BAA-1237 / DSM 17374 / SPN1) TaxID=760011 RepID=F4GM74_PARC1|nr:fimbrillin family protein [Parasphaerochaeta coccoides]AEC03050.1 regulator of chromosome condensation RCC1 [Parasphaerochaeta coccoides DSM 17374]